MLQDNVSKGTMMQIPQESEEQILFHNSLKGDMISLLHLEIWLYHIKLFLDWMLFP